MEYGGAKIGYRRGNTKPSAQVDQRRLIPRLPPAAAVRPGIQPILGPERHRMRRLTHEQGAALLGARMFGRFKSGAPIDLTPRFDDSALGSDPTRNNDFNFMPPGMNVTLDQTRCPFSAHIRKTNPRSEITPSCARASPSGPELTPDEIALKTTSIDRGLAFVSYQSDLSAGFRFQQQVWADNTA
ncbi:hypothetical protein BU17DRAFT_97522 [Hysterangium stoloniferum]|nr:hypothetical protein BU17DRAFT_97522 [Hysterangium stoloniferum]